MILKNFELNKIDLNKSKLILFYGINEGYKNQEIKKLHKNYEEIINYEEKEIIDNLPRFLESILNKSFFEKKKLIIIKRASDKILKLLEQINYKNIDDTSILINAGNLDKKSKLRIFFEKDKSFICSAFYPDNNQSLLRIASSYLKSKNILISQLNLNFIIDRSNEDRELLYKELDKIILYAKTGKKIDLEVVNKLTTSSEDHNISILIDSCLAKNKKKTLNMLNDNNYNDDDSITIIRTFLNKLKKLLVLSISYENNQNLDLTINSAKPAIFWKDKEIVKLQINKWQTKQIKELIYKLNKLELIAKKNLKNSFNLIVDFILENTKERINN